MSHQVKNLKEQIKKAFDGVESSEFLEIQITKGKGRLSEIFVEYMARHPQSNFREWSEKLIDQHNINSVVPEEITAIGISLLSLDALEHDITDMYVNSIKSQQKN